MSEQNELPERIVSGGESLDIFEIMHRFRNDGSCEYIIKEALENLVRTATPSPSVGEQVRKAAEEILSRLEDWRWFPESNARATIARIITKHLSSPVDVEAMRQAYEHAAQIAETCTQDDATRDEPFRIAQTIRTVAESLTTVPSREESDK